jgi:S1-C subfamily serine protease
VTESQGQVPNCSYVASLITKDKNLDVALLKISGIGGATVSGLPFLTLNTANTLNVGDTVTAIGYPGIGGNTMTTTKGIVSGKIDNQYNVSWIKTDALISFGSSGGALIDDSGKLVGITTALSSSLSASLGYAVNTASVASWVNKNLGS